MTDTPLPIRTLDGAAWSCGACGKCCRGYEFGPVSEPIIRGLEALDIASAWPLAGELPWYEERVAPDGSKAFFLSKVDDHCIFLQDDNLCAVHARFGAEAKPAFCREFPIHLVRDPTGVVAIVRADCGTFHESFDGDEAVEPQAREVLEAERVVPMRTFAPERVEVFPGQWVKLDTWLVWEAELQAMLDATVLDPEAGVAMLRDELAKRLGREPVAASAARGRMALQAVVQGITMMVGKAATESDARATPEQRAFAQEMLGWLQQLQAFGMADMPPLDTRTQAYLHVQLRSFWLARQWSASGTVLDGLGAHLFHVSACRALAAADVDGPVTASAFSDRYTSWRRLSVNRAVEWVLGKAAPALQDVARHGV